MTEPEQKLTPATPDDLADSLSFALRFEGRKSQHDSDRLNADIVAKRLVRYLDKARYVVRKKPRLGALSGGRGVCSKVTRHARHPQDDIPVPLSRTARMLRQSTPSKADGQANRRCLALRL
jgi:hypothetical protein